MIHYYLLSNIWHAEIGWNVKFDNDKADKAKNILFKKYCLKLLSINPQ